MRQRSLPPGYPPWHGPDEDGVIVAFSGGKDSLCLLHECVQRYDRVVPYHRYFLRGLDFTASLVAYCRDRYGLDLILMQDPAPAEFVTRGVFRYPRRDVPLLKLRVCDDYVRRLTGLTWVAVGFRMQESLESNAMVKRDWPYGMQVPRRYFAPMYAWGPRHVRAYIAQHKLPMPPTCAEYGNGRSGFDLKPDNVAWVKKYWPRDCERLIRMFPEAALQPERSEELKRVRAQEREARRAARRLSG